MATTKLFKSGNSVAVRLPAAFAAKAGTPVEVREEKGTWVIAPVPQERRKIDVSGFAGKLPGFMAEGRGETDQDDRDWTLGDARFATKS